MNMKGGVLRQATVPIAGRMFRSEPSRAITGRADALAAGMKSLIRQLDG